MVKQAGAYGLMSDPDVDPDIRSLQHMLLFGLKGMAAYTDHAAEHGQEDDANYEFVHRAMISSIWKPCLKPVKAKVFMCTPMVRCCLPTGIPNSRNGFPISTAITARPGRTRKKSLTRFPVPSS
jgi:hypothetical protein